MTADLVRWRRWLAAVLVMGIVAVTVQGAIGRAAALSQLADGPRPYFVVAHAGLLYGAVPLALLASFALYLAPGLFTAVAMGWSGSFVSWVTAGFLLSLVEISIVFAGVAAWAPARVVGPTAGFVVLGLAAACGTWADRTVKQGRRLPPPWVAGDGWTACLAIALVLVTYWTMAPKFLWENFNGDGVHAFESSRRLLRHALPFWPPSAGAVSHFPGVTSMLFAFPNAFFLRLFGSVDASARVPFLLYLPMLFAAILALAGREGRRAPVLTQAAVAVGLLAYAFAMGFSATYSPYSADLALPATQDTLLMVCFLAAADAYWRREWAQLGVATALTYISLPNGLILLGFLLVADVLVTRPYPWKQAVRLALTMVACVFVGALLPMVVRAAGGPPPGGEYGTAGILRYFAFLQFTDWTRLALMAVPAGIFPILVLFRWPLLDRMGRSLALVTAGYFLFFFVQAQVSLHHFVPAMLLPVPVAVRTASRAVRSTTRWSAAWLAAAAAALVFSLPERFALQTDGRQVGQSVSINTGDYAASDPAAFGPTVLLARIFPYDWDPSVPFSSYGGSPLVWNRYAVHGPATPATNYAIVAHGTAAPNGMEIVAADTLGDLYVRDRGRWRADLDRRPPTPAGSATYFLPRWILFRAVPPAGGPPIIDVVATLESWGVDMNPFLNRLGVKR